MQKTPRIFYQLQKAHSALFRAADKSSKATFGLTVSQQAVLFLLSRKDGQPISDLAQTLSMGNSSLTGLVDRMCQKGFVRREVLSSDARVVQIFIEQQGRELIEKSLPAIKKYNQQLLAPFNEEEWQVIGRFLSHVSDNADEIINGPEVSQELERAADG